VFRYQALVTVGQALINTKKAFFEIIS
jgi:hypothetical protein